MKLVSQRNLHFFFSKRTQKNIMTITRISRFKYKRFCTSSSPISKQNDGRNSRQRNHNTSQPERLAVRHRIVSDNPEAEPRCGSFHYSTQPGE
ncbi:hypothetical protein Dsin_030526 [Dipteronia sinensis]|uniref:Uncharacterized protein n=1 Tax=Dipteronia sinensis TaxID=43782 RepID=A0AAD9ZKR4_9ROSI|nr:hypothetical protein Dsin_030526 [Dipteronia sinensis]